MVEVTGLDPAVTHPMFEPLAMPTVLVASVAVTDPLTATVPVETTLTMPPMDEIATARAGMVDVTALDPADTHAVLPPLISAKVPDDTEVIVGLDDSVALSGPLADENATISAGIVDVTGLEPAVTQAVLPPLISVMAPDDTEATVGLDDSVTVAELMLIGSGPPTVETATTMADIVEVTGLEPAVIHTVLEPLIRAM